MQTLTSLISVHVTANANIDQRRLQELPLSVRH